jgi:hypothetical protein
MTEELSVPPPLPNSEIASQASNEWYYVLNGARQGPTTATVVGELLKKKTIAADTQVWRKGMTEWKTVRESDLSELVAAEPPAISPQQISNVYVWTLAFMPLVFGLVEASNVVQNDFNLFRASSLVSGSLGLLDYFTKLKKAGYNSWGLRATSLLVPPVYLFWRAKVLKQRPYYAIAWIVSLIISLLLVSSA